MAFATVVSLVPFPIREPKPGLVPPIFEIAAAKEGDFELLLIQDAHFGVYIDEARGTLRVTSPASTVAESLCNDYIQGQLMRNEYAYPGIFWVDGKQTKESIREKYSEELTKAAMAQIEWFKLLVAAADDDWARYHQHKMITDIQRFAGKTLGLTGKRDWLVDMVPDMPKTQCPACGGTILQNIVICPHCSAILDKERAKQFQFATVK